jgi:predicted Fe-Mo cluster-binding NifX family protein
MATKSFIIRRKVRSTSSEFAFTFRRNQRSTSVGVHTNEAVEKSFFDLAACERAMQRRVEYMLVRTVGERAYGELQAD